MRQYSKALVIFAATLALAPAVSAAERGQQTTGVSYRDLDLRTDAGQAELDQRIDRAARQVCNMDEMTLGTRIPSRGAQACYVQAKRQLDEQFAVVMRDVQLGG